MCGEGVLENEGVEERDTDVTDIIFLYWGGN